jgi:hypothetical protein
MDFSPGVIFLQYQENDVYALLSSMNFPLPLLCQHYAKCYYAQTYVGIICHEKIYYHYGRM